MRSRWSPPDPAPESGDIAPGAGSDVQGWCQLSLGFAVHRLVARGPRVAGLHNTDALGPDKQPGQGPRKTLVKLALPWRYQRVTAASHGSENGPRFPPVAPRAGRRWRFGEILMEIRLIIGTDRLFLLNGRRNGPLRRGAAAGCPWAPVLFAMAGGTERRCAAEVGLRGKGQLRRLISTP